MTDPEMAEFFTTAFRSVGLGVDPGAMRWMTLAAAGLPKIMHLVGDCVFWHASSGQVDAGDALAGVLDASEEVGQKFVDGQILDAIQSEDYRASPDKLAKRLGINQTTFTRKELADGLPRGECEKLDKFLRRMRDLKVIRQTRPRGPYEFTVRMVQIYLWLRGLRQEPTGSTRPAPQGGGRSRPECDRPRRTDP